MSISSGPVMEEVLGYVAIFFAGLTLGLIGGGGSILSIPILVYLFRMDIVAATAYSLFIVGITSVVGALQRTGGSTINFKVALAFGIPSILTVFTTRNWLIPNLPDVLFQWDELLLTKRLFILGLFSALVIVASFFMIKSNATEKNHELHAANPAALPLQGIAIGFITGLVGVGGGFLIVPSLFFMAKINMRTAIGTTLPIIAAMSLVGFLGDVINQPIDWKFLAIVSFISIAGILLGTKYSEQLSASNLKKTFGWFTLVVGMAIFINEAFF